MTNDKKILGVSTIAVIALILIAVASTYAFFKGTDAGDTDTPLTVTTNTTDSLVFNVDTDISMVADMSNFTEGKGNREGISHATATLKANNKTNNATGNYYLYFDIKENELAYTTEDNTAELLLQVNGPDGALGSGDITGLTYVTVTDGKGVSISGFDITEVQDLITIVSNKEITTTSEKVDNWEIKVILVNLNEDQSSNGGKRFNGSIVIQKDEIVFPLLANYIKNTVYTGTQGENNIYYHKNLTNSAEDGSYRYSGSYESVNNYVCFGSNKAKCPWDNMYRIIGVFDNQVKLIKADYAKSSELGISGDYKSDYKTSMEVNTWPYDTNKGQNIASEIGGYYWNYSNTTNSKNIWAESRLNKENLNGTYLNHFDENWQEKITMTAWKVGGNIWAKIGTQNAATAYQNEIVSPVQNTIESKKIGLIFVSDYMYGASQNNWSKIGSGTDDYRNAIDENWMYGGLTEWTITRCTDNDSSAFFIDNDGHVNGTGIYGHGLAIRPVFYLEADVQKTIGDGSLSNPYRILL